MDPVLALLDIDPQVPPQLAAIKRLDFIRSAVSFPPESHEKGFKQMLILRHLKVDRVETGLVLSTLAIKPSLTNRYNTLHGGAVAMIASMVGLAAVKTIAADKEFVQTEMSMSYLSAGRIGVSAFDMFVSLLFCIIERFVGSINQSLHHLGFCLHVT